LLFDGLIDIKKTIIFYKGSEACRAPAPSSASFFALLAKMVCSLFLHKISAVVSHAELVPITLLDVMGTSDTKTRKLSFATLK
jgi:hypothetical protein